MASQSSAPSETSQSAAEKFFKYFQHEITALQEQMDRLGDTALVGGERKDATDHCLAGITLLSSEVRDASGTLPAYDLRTYSEAIKALQDKLAETQAQHTPKQRFSFKIRKNDSAVSIHDAAELAAQKQKSMLTFGTTSNPSSTSSTPIHVDSPPNEAAGPRAGALSSSGLHQETAAGTLSQSTSNRDNMSNTAAATVSAESASHIILPSSASRASTPCHISSLKGCCVDLSGPTSNSAPFASLTINDVQSSLLLCGSIAGPAHITNVKNSSILVSCRQFRMHDCENITIYLYCTSRPIIESCKGIAFAPMPTFYTESLHSATSIPNEAISTNMWDHIDDFKWLRPEPSPNFKILPAEQRIPEASWKEIIPSKPGMSLHDILKIVSVKG